jgi:predicted  nucleic acid-binding Zn-ribbon protein
LAEDSLGEYIRPQDEDIMENSSIINKSQEIDLLWQSFKSAQFTTNSPAIYVITGFIIGVLSTVILFACVNASSIKSKGLKSGLFGVEKVKTEPAQTLEEQAQDAQDEMNNKVSVPSEDDFTAPAESVNTDTAQAETSSVDTSKMKKYIVKNGDTVESIIKKAYGSYTPERAELIMKANNLKTLDRINIDQELLLPAE